MRHHPQHTYKVQVYRYYYMRDTLQYAYHCPECSAPVIWSLSNGRPGSTGTTKCANNLTTSRADWRPGKTRFCNWSGLAVRREDGRVDLFLKDGTTRLRPRMR